VKNALQYINNLFNKIPNKRGSNKYNLIIRGAENKEAVFGRRGRYLRGVEDWTRLTFEASALTAGE